MSSRASLTISAVVALAIGISIAATAEQNELPDPLAAGWEGESVCERVHEDESLRVLRCTFPPGVGHERHYHAPHFGYVIDGGRMQITDGEGTRMAELPDDLTWESEGVEWHEVLNVGDTTSTYLIVEPKD